MKKILLASFLVFCSFSAHAVDCSGNLKCIPKEVEFRRLYVDKDGDIFLFRSRSDRKETEYLGNCYQKSLFSFEGSELEPEISSKDICDLCPNRGYFDKECILGKEPFGNHYCYTEEPVVAPKKICDLCSNREYIDGKCILKNTNE